jgi:hypothetical protein
LFHIIMDMDSIVALLAEMDVREMNEYCWHLTFHDD